MLVGLATAMRAEGVTDDAGPPPMAAGQFWALLMSTVGVFAIPSLLRLSRGGPLGATMSDARVLGVVALELLIGLFWARRLASQGWTITSITHPFLPRDLLRGTLLFVAAWIAYYLTFVFAVALAPRFAAAARNVTIDGRLSFPVVLLISLINPVAEEFLYLGVIAASLRREDSLLALSASVLARVCVHVYQGPLGVLSIAPAAVVFGAYYLRTRRIWPVVAAHGFMDALALTALSQAA